MKRIVLSVLFLSVMYSGFILLAPSDEAEELELSPPVASRSAASNELFLERALSYEYASTEGHSHIGPSNEAPMETGELADGSRSPLGDSRIITNGETVSIVEPSSSGISSDAFFASDYASYPDDTLSTLAEMGDTTAAQVLAMRYFTEKRSSKNLEQAKQLLNDAAVAGANYYPFSILAEQSGYELERALRQEAEMSAEARSDTLVETFSYAQLASLRGNDVLMARMERRFRDEFGVEPSPEEWSRIYAKAGEWLADLEEKRIAAGLGAFE